MKIYWALESVPEFSNMSPRERRRIWRRIGADLFRRWEPWCGILACGLCAGAGSVIGEALGNSLIGGAAGGLVGGVVFSQIVIHAGRRRYRDLVSRGEIL